MPSECRCADTERLARNLFSSMILIPLSTDREGRSDEQLEAEWDRQWEETQKDYLSLQMHIHHCPPCRSVAERVVVELLDRGRSPIVRALEERGASPDEAREMWGEARESWVDTFRTQFGLGDPAEGMDAFHLPMDKGMPFVVVRDVAWGARPGEHVAVRAEEWLGFAPRLEGWRGPHMEPEYLDRHELELLTDCGNLMTDMGGFWECFSAKIRRL